MDRKRFIGLTAESVINDVQVVVERTPWNTLKITWDMSPETQEILEIYSATKGHALDDLLQDLNAEVMAKWAAKAKQEARATGPARRRREALAAKIADIEAEKAKLEAMIEAEREAVRTGQPVKFERV